MGFILGATIFVVVVGLGIAFVRDWLTPKDGKDDE